MNIKKWFNENTQSLTGKTVAITGATGGLGTNLCMYLAQLGARLLMLNRSEKKTIELKNKILSIYPDTQIKFIKLDQAVFAEVKAVTKQLESEEIDYFIINAGIYNVPIVTTDSGYNNVFQVNFLSPYYLVKSLLPILQKRNGKIIVVGSVAHRYSKIDETDIDFSRVKGCSKIYGNSKRFLMFAFYELFKDRSDVSLAVAHPGVTLTNMTNHYPKAINWLVKIGVRLLFPSPEFATLNILAALFTDCDYLEWIGPSFCDIWGIPKKSKLYSCESAERKRIFEIAESIYNEINTDEK